MLLKCYQRVIVVSFLSTRPISHMSTPPSNQPSRRTRRRKGDTTNSPNSTEAHNVRLSKSLSYILRHGALKEGLKIRPDGFVRVDDIVS
jgi:2'-phosphotransferase